MSIEIVFTADGSHTLQNSEIGDTYHSIHGAIQESRHVFINAGLEHILDSNPAKINILEVGFGTGLNAYLTLLHQDQIKIDYTALEPFPIGEEVYSLLNYSEELNVEADSFRALHDTRWNKNKEITTWFSLKKIVSKIESTELPLNHFDLLYYDAFGPGKQPEMWELPVLIRLFSFIKPGGHLVTYCSKGQFQRDLRRIGFEVELPPGPPGKFEIVRARK